MATPTDEQHQGVWLTQEAHDRLKAELDTFVQARIEELAEKSTGRSLTEEERAEYEGYVRANMFIAILQRQARKLVAALP